MEQVIFDGFMGVVSVIGAILVVLTVVKKVGCC